MSTGDAAIQSIFHALAFAAARHKDQRRKGAGAPPFINHAIDVAYILARLGGITDSVTLQAAVLHDTLEDTDTTAEELEAEFGAEVTSIVQEVTDDKRLDREERKRRQVESAPHLSDAAKVIRLADKITNIRSIAHAPPTGWSLERRLDYVEWSRAVIAGCRGCCSPLEQMYDEALHEALQVLGEQSDGPITTRFSSTE